MEKVLNWLFPSFQKNLNLLQLVSINYYEFILLLLDINYMS